jgi:hypothetical protein
VHAWLCNTTLRIGHIGSQRSGSTREGHRTAGSCAEAAAASVKAGVDMLCDKPDLVSTACGGL